MPIGELIAALEEMAEQYGDECEVRLAFQPSWPFEYSIGDVVAVPEGFTGDEYDEDSMPTIFIGEDEQLGYLPGNAAEALGWRDEE